MRPSRGRGYKSSRKDITGNLVKRAYQCGCFGLHITDNPVQSGWNSKGIFCPGEQEVERWAVSRFDWSSRQSFHQGPRFLSSAALLSWCQLHPMIGFPFGQKISAPSDWHAFLLASTECMGVTPRRCPKRMNRNFSPKPWKSLIACH